MSGSWGAGRVSIVFLQTPLTMAPRPLPPTCCVLWAVHAEALCADGSAGCTERGGGGGRRRDGRDPFGQQQVAFVGMAMQGSCSHT
jgi:hypothetical protein